MNRFDLDQRASGVLLHPTSLPGPAGCGNLGLEARRFIAFLASARQRYWQMLPIGPVGYGNSPYSALSTFAGNPLLISLEMLVEEGLLDPAQLIDAPRGGADRVDYGTAARFHDEALRAAFAKFSAVPEKGPGRKAFNRFCDVSEPWLEDFALYSAVKREHGQRSWTTWEPAIRARKRSAMKDAKKRLATDIEFHRFEQWLFDRQWRSLKAFAAENGVGLIGDIPIFVAHDSADVWAHPDLFQLNDDGQPRFVAGVPPDYFSVTGQRWGNPLYKWSAHERKDYQWWIDRLEMTLSRFDAVRLDHFIGFERYWEIPGDEATAENGRWQPGPGADLFKALRRVHGSLPLIAEDLGLVTDEVKALRDRFGLPGIKILQFAFGGDPQAPDFLPHNYPRRAVAYTGSHDNDTTVGWFGEKGGEASTRSAEQTEKERRQTLDYLGAKDGKEIHWAMIRTLLSSVANVAIIPMQDLLGLGSEARMNRPGTAEGNWEWRMREGADSPEIAERLGRLTRLFGREAPAIPIAKQRRGRTAKRVALKTIPVVPVEGDEAR